MSKKYKRESAFTYIKPSYLHHTPEYGGYLPATENAYALWHYCRHAMIHLEGIRNGALYEGDSDPLLDLPSILHSTQVIYEIENPEDMFQHIGAAKAEAIRCELPWDVRIQDPVGQKNRTSKQYMPEAKSDDNP